ncbi:hypothetical protein HYX10_04985 [Candidatus Woesearchaeota archaeon]|nr:hypothetical protein [Candidatus Woesearchaeota archaeon]
MMTPNIRNARQKNKPKTGNAEKIVTSFIVLAVLAAALSFFYVSKSLFFPGEGGGGQQQTSHFSSAGFTAFDVELAKKLMDKDSDGKCDSCGMDLEFCIQSGQLQCSMDPKSTIGVLDTTKEKHHYHADFKVYISGEEIDFSQQKYFVKSRFIHVENDVQGDSGKVLHMHASGVPLWVFFESVGMKFNESCFVTDGREAHCNNNGRTLSFYTNGKQNPEYESYVFQDGDRILISYGSENGEEIKKQLSSITDFAKNH